jgi:hypothetical protein
VRLVSSFNACCRFSTCEFKSAADCNVIGQLGLLLLLVRSVVFLCVVHSRLMIFL